MFGSSTSYNEYGFIFSLLVSTTFVVQFGFITAKWPSVGRVAAMTVVFAIDIGLTTVIFLVWGAFAAFGWRGPPSWKTTVLLLSPCITPVAFGIAFLCSTVQFVRKERRRRVELGIVEDANAAGPAEGWTKRRTTWALIGMAAASAVGFSMLALGVAVLGPRCWLMEQPYPCNDNMTIVYAPLIVVGAVLVALTALAAWRFRRVAERLDLLVSDLSPVTGFVPLSNPSAEARGPYRGADPFSDTNDDASASHGVMGGHGRLHHSPV